MGEDAGMYMVYMMDRFGSCTWTTTPSSNPRLGRLDTQQPTPKPTHIHTNLDVEACPGRGLEEEEAVLLRKLLPLLRRHRAPEKRVGVGVGVGGQFGQ